MNFGMAPRFSGIGGHFPGGISAGLKGNPDLNAVSSHLAAELGGTANALVTGFKEIAPVALAVGALAVAEKFVDTFAGDGQNQKNKQRSQFAMNLGMNGPSGPGGPG